MINHIFDKNGNAKYTCTVLVFHYDSETGEFIQPQKVRIIRGTGIPAFSTLVQPDIIEGKCPVFDGTGWIQFTDHRGKIITNDGVTKYVMNALGMLPEGFSFVEEEPNHG